MRSTRSRAYFPPALSLELQRRELWRSLTNLSLVEEGRMQELSDTSHTIETQILRSQLEPSWQKESVLTFKQVVELSRIQNLVENGQKPNIRPRLCCAHSD